MAAVTPVSAGTAGYVDPQRGLFTGAQADTEALLSVGTYVRNRSKYVTEIYYFAAVGDGDTWASLKSGIKACFWKGDTRHATVTDNTTVSISDATAGTIIFENAATANGWLLLFREVQASEVGRRAL